MISKELLQKVRQIEIKTSRLVTDIFAGQYHSVFKGQGIEFDEVREYQVGDDVRTIDWNVTARMRKPFVKKFIEERELTVMILVDTSASMNFSSKGRLKSQVAAEVSSLLSLSAIKNQDKVGVVFFSDQVEKFIPPRKGSRHVLRIVREILSFDPKHSETNLQSALEFLNRVSTRKTIVFLLSDFLDCGIEKKNESLKRLLSITNQKHDLIAITVNDRRENQWSNVGLVDFEDAESHTKKLIDVSGLIRRKKFKEENNQRRNYRKSFFQSLGIDVIDIWTQDTYVDEIVRFFRKRQRR